MKKVRKTTTAINASIVGGILYFEDVKQCDIDSDDMPDIVGDGYTNSIRLESLSSNWFERYYIDATTFIKTDLDVQMTLRREIRSGRGHWYAYRRVFGKLHKKYVGTDEKLTNQRLLEVAQKMPAK